MHSICWHLGPKLGCKGVRRFKQVRVPGDFGRWSITERLAAVQQRFLKHDRERGGLFADFGYRYCDSFDTSMLLDPDGDVV